MIDYLERLFVREETRWEGEETQFSPSPVQTEETVEPLAVSRFRDEEDWRQEAARRLESALTVEDVSRRLTSEQAQPLPRPHLTGEEPRAESYSLPEPYRSREMEGAQGLEHRLRRNSRRYDSGFFLY